jgi:hypothetical protein
VLPCERDHADGNWENLLKYRDEPASSPEPHCFLSSGRRAPLCNRTSPDCKKTSVFSE